MKFLIFLLFVSIQAWAGENEFGKNYRHGVSTDLSVYLYRIGGGHQNFKNLIRPIIVYDNDVLKGSPIFTISNESIIDNRTNKKFDFSNYYKAHNTLNEQDVDDMYYIKDLPFEFITAENLNFQLKISEYNKGLATIVTEGKKYFFKINETEALKNDNINWVTETSNQSIQKLYEEDKEFAKLINEFRNCVEKKNIKCLDSISEGFSTGVEELKAVCNKFREDQVVLNSEKKMEYKLIDWELYKRFFSLIDPKLKIRFEHRNFGHLEDLTLTLVSSKKVCGRDTGLLINFLRKKNYPKWELFVHSEPFDG